MQRTRGFTLMELLVVLTLIALLASLVAPVVSNSISRAKEASLKESLAVMRKAIDDYYADKGNYPKELKDLVDGHYIRGVPPDPFTERTDTWVVVREDGEVKDPGIIDVHSGSDDKADDGTAYKDW